MTTNISSSSILEFNPTHLSSKEKDILRELENYDLSFVAERIRKNKLIPANSINNAIFKFKQFIGLTILGHRSLSVLSEDVDKVWHNFILYTKEYCDFSNHFNGSYIHHCPNDSKFSQHNNLTQDSTIQTYRKCIIGWEIPKNSYRECSTDSDDTCYNNCGNS